MRPLVLVPVLLTLSCGPGGPVVETPSPISARSLHDSYVDGSERWTGRRIRVNLAPGSFKVSGRELHWHPARDTDPPGVVWECRDTLPTAPALTVTGTVAGKVRVRDRWHVLVKDAEATAAESR